MAHGAEDVLRQADCYATLEEAVKDIQLIFGTTRRIRKINNRLFPLREGLSDITGLSQTNQIGILFGNEDKGLDNTAIARCNRLINIPMVTRHPSLNISHAVMITAYELHQLSARPAYFRSKFIATQDDYNFMLDRFQRMLHHSLFCKDNNITIYLRGLNKMLKKRELEKSEINLLHRLLKHLEKFFPDPSK